MIKIEDATEDQYFTNKKLGWIKPGNNPGKLQNTLTQLADAFKKLAELDRANMLETIERLTNVLEKSSNSNTNS